MLAGMNQEQTNEYNRNHCKRIALDVEAYANGEMYRCPECGQTFHWDDDNYNDDQATYICPCCGEQLDESDLEAQSLWDYFEDMLDIEYIVESDRKTIKGVRILVTCGGPNIWVDTMERAVKLYWWTDRAEYPLSWDVCDELDEFAQELWGC